MKIPPELPSFNETLAGPETRRAEFAPFNAFVLYENAEAGHRAVHMLRRIAQQAGEPAVPRAKLWRFDLLQYPAWDREARQDADQADLIIIATGSSDDLPSPVNTWLGECVARKDGRNLAMIALFGSNQGWSLSLQDSARFYAARQVGTPTFAATPQPALCLTA